MKYTKQAAQRINWLENVEGKTISDAIEYLLTLDKSCILGSWADAADDTGLRWGGEVYKVVPMTKGEEFEERTKHLRSRIIDYEKTMKSRYCQTPERQALYNQLVYDLKVKIEKIKSECKD